MIGWIGGAICVLSMFIPGAIGWVVWGIGALMVLYSFAKE